MKRILTLLCCALSTALPANTSGNHFYQAAMHQALGIIKQNHAYFSDLNLDWTCIEKTYIERAQQAANSQEILHAFEHLMLEFTDNHMMLNTNNNDSYRLYSPVVVKKTSEGFLIEDFWKSHLVSSEGLKVGAQLLQLNEKNPKQIIATFPTSCLNKQADEIQTWIINKALAGIYSKPRIIKLSDGSKTKSIDLDQLETKKQSTPLTQEKTENIAYHHHP